MKTAASSYLRIFLRLGLIIVCLINLLGSVPLLTVRAATLTVTNTSDSGAGSLRQALADAAAGDTIVFNAGLSGQTITLASTLTLSKNLTIDGSALTMPITLSGNDAVRILLNAAVVVLKNLKLVHGSVPSGNGGAIYNDLHLTLINCTVSNNTASSGGGVYNDGSLFVESSTFASNSAVRVGAFDGYGGAIFAGATGVGSQIFVTNSTFHANSGYLGGAIYNQLSPMNWDGVIFTNNTFISNTASNVGGAIYNGYGARLWIYNNIMAYSGYLAGDCHNSQGTIVDQKNNYIMSNPNFGCGPDLYGDAFFTGLGDYGGPTQTMAPLPGSVSYNRGYGPKCPATDQRGVARPQGSACDVGAFEAELPVVTTTAASGINATGATLNASINARFSETTTSFEYGRTTAYGSTVSGTPLKVNGGTGTAVSAAIGGLEFNRTYHFRAKGVSGAGTTLGLDQAFTTTCGAAVTVQNTNDSGDGSLRQALLDTCAGGTITFNSSLSGQVIRFLTTITLDKSITIDGAGLSTPIALSGDSTGDGTPDLRIFIINNGVTATLKKLTLTKGKATGTNGGAILNAGTLTLQNITLTESTTSNFGGAISNSGTLTISDSTFSGNATTGAATKGGAVYSSGTLNVASSTFIGNSAILSGGAITNNGTLDLLNTTFSGNSAPTGGGLEVASGRTATLRNVTFSGNAAATKGGGIFSAGTLNLSNTILANSAAPEDCKSTGTVSTNNNNLIEINSGCGAPALTSDPNLGALANNGGPTQTFALIAGSPAIDAGHSGSCPALDQRGVPRPQGAGCDIGALEKDTTPPSVTIEQAAGQADPANGFPINFTVTFSEPIDPATFTPGDILQGGTATSIVWQITDGGAHITFTLAATSSSVGTLIPSLPAGSVQDFSLFGNTLSSSVDNSVFFCANSATVTSLADSGPGTLRAALLGACVNGTINFHTSLAGGTILLSSPLVLMQNVTLNGLIGDQRLTLTLDGQNTVRVMQVNVGVTANLDALAFAHGKAASGAGLLNSGTLKVTRSAFFGNTSTSTGGGIENVSGGTLTLANSTFYSNSATQKGGGIYNSGTLTSKNNTLTLNTSAQGGGIYNAAGATLNFANTLAANSTGGDCSNAGTISLNLKNLTEDHSCAAELFGDPLLAEPGWYYGPTNTAALLPGSIAIDTGDLTTCTTSPVNSGDQRGLERPDMLGFPPQFLFCDIGAYESSGTYIEILDPPNGNNQSTAINTYFAQPFKASILARGGGYGIEPVLGGKVTFSAPASGASATFNPMVATIEGPDGNGWYYALGYATANGQIGTYQVNAKTAGARDMSLENTSGINFTATNCYAGVVVTSSADSGAGSLRQALADVCPGATITFDASLSGQTIALASSLSLIKNVTIDGSTLAQQVKLSGENAVRVMVINSGMAATLKNLSITKGKAINTGCGSLCGGAGFYNAGSLALIDSRVTENVSTSVNGGGIFSTGNLTITGTTFSNNAITIPGSGYGGAVYFAGSTLSIDRSVFNANAGSSLAGAIYALAPFSINASSFTGNTSNVSAGAIYMAYTSTTPSTITGSTFSGNSGVNGGAIFSNAALNVTNSTFSGNSASANGGGLYMGRPLTLLNSTFSGNSAATSGGAVYILGLGVLNYTNTILANSPSGQDCFLNGATLGTNLNNLVESSTGCGTPAFTADPALGTLGNYGGATQTMVLLVGSPALNSGDAAACPATDQRGVARPQGAGCDLGAYELQLPAATTLPVSNRTVRGFTLNGLVNAHFATATLTFEYGLTTAYGTTVSAVPGTATGGMDTPVSAVISGLSPTPIYHYRVLAVNTVGTTYGQDLTFSLTYRINLPVIMR